MELKMQFSESLRIVWAVAAKDIGDALKNKVIWSTLVMVLLLVLFYRALPALTGMAHLPEVDVFDPGESAVMTLLDNSPNLEVRRVASQAAAERFVTMEGVPALSLVLPANFDQQLAQGGPVELDGYVQHWIGAAEAAALVAQVEREIAAVTGKTVSINLEGHQLYPALDSMGPHSWAALSVVIMLVVLGMGLTPQLLFEEKRSHTLEALLLSPARSEHVVAGKAIAGLFYCMIGAVLILIFNAVLVVQWAVAILAALLGGLLAVAAGLLLGVLLQIPQSLRIWTAAVIVPLFVLPVVLSFMAMDLPPSVNAMVRFFPSAALSRLFILSMTNQAPFAEWGLDVALIAAATVALLAVVAWRVRRLDR